MRLSNRLFQQIFIDKVKLFLKGGNGGHGNTKFCGKGGNGGNILLFGNSKTQIEDIVTAFPSYQIKAPNGADARKNYIVGSNGADIVIKVPTGTEVSLRTGELLGTIYKRDDQMIVCRGGVGGGPLNNYSAQIGETVKITLNMKLIADVGLLGFPNAGKSSLLNRLSGAPAKIANYAFTTLKPQVATIRYPDNRSISMADLPGIIEGAHVNVGLGYHFLKHLERTKVHLFVVDLHGFRLESKNMVTSYRPPLETVALLVRELGLFNRSLLTKPAICVLNKVDKPEGAAIAEEVRDRLMGGGVAGLLEEGDESDLGGAVRFERVLAVSAATGEGCADLLAAIREVLDERQRQMDDPEDLLDTLVTTEPS